MLYNGRTTLREGLALLNELFHPENFIFRWCAKLFDLVVLSILWAMLCVPVVTIGPATAALYYAVVKCVRRGEDDTYRNFFTSFRQNFKVGSVAGLIAVGLGLFFLWNTISLGVMAEGGDRTALALSIAYRLLLWVVLGAAAFLFPVLSRFTLGVGGLYLKSLQLALRHLPSALVLSLLLLEMTQLTWRYLFLLLITPGLTALLASLFLERVFKKYTPPEPPEDGRDDEVGVAWYLK